MTDQQFDPNCLTATLDPGTKEAGNTYCTDYLMKEILQHNYSLVITAHYLHFCSTKHVKSFATWQFALNFTNLGKKV